MAKSSERKTYNLGKPSNIHVPRLNFKNLLFNPLSSTQSNRNANNLFKTLNSLYSAAQGQKNNLNSTSNSLKKINTIQTTLRNFKSCQENLIQYQQR